MIIKKAESAYTLAGGLGGMLAGGKIGQKLYDKSVKERNKKLLHRLRMKVSRGYRDQQALDRFGATMLGSELGGILGGSAGAIKDGVRRSKRKRFSIERNRYWDDLRKKKQDENDKWWKEYEERRARRKKEQEDRWKSWEEDRKREREARERARRASSSGSSSGGRRSYDYRRRSYKANANLEAHLKTIGVSESVKKKSEVKKIYRKKAFAIHPDRNPGMDDGPLKSLNNAWDEIQRTSWYEKLAFILGDKSHERLALGNISLRASLKLASDK